MRFNLDYNTAIILVAGAIGILSILYPPVLLGYVLLLVILGYTRKERIEREKCKGIEVIPKSFNDYIDRLQELSIDREIDLTLYLYFRGLKVDSLWQHAIVIKGKDSDEIKRIIRMVFREYKIRDYQNTPGEFNGVTLLENELISLLQWTPSNYGIGRNLDGFLEEPMDTDIPLGRRCNRRGNAVIGEAGISMDEIKNGVLVAGNILAVAHVNYMAKYLAERYNLPVLLVDCVGEMEHYQGKVVTGGQDLKLDPTTVPDRAIGLFVSEAIRIACGVDSRVKHYISELLSRRDFRTLADLARTARNDSSPGPEVARILGALIRSEAFAPLYTAIAPLEGIIDIHHLDTLPRLVYLATIMAHQAAALQPKPGKIRGIVIVNASDNHETEFVRNIIPEMSRRGIGIILRTSRVLPGFSTIIAFPEALVRSKSIDLNQAGLGEFEKFAKLLHPNEAMLVVNMRGPWLYLPVFSFSVTPSLYKLTPYCSPLAEEVRCFLSEGDAYENGINIVSRLVGIERDRLFSVLEQNGIITHHEREKLENKKDINMLKAVLMRLAPWYRLLTVSGENASSTY